MFDPLNLPYLLRRDSFLLFSFLDWLIDVDECSNTGLNDCSQLCENTNGSYQCSCASGFSLQPDKTTCTGKKKHQTSSESQTLFAFNLFVCLFFFLTEKLVLIVESRFAFIWLVLRY